MRYKTYKSLRIKFIFVILITLLWSYLVPLTSYGKDNIKKQTSAVNENKAKKPSIDEVRQWLSNACGATNKEFAINNYSKAINSGVLPKIEFFLMYYDIGITYAEMGHFEEAINDWEKAIKFATEENDKIFPYSELAWLLSTSPDSKYRDGKKALSLANKLVKIQGGYTLEILAAAYAEVGNFDDAIRSQESAIDWYNNREIDCNHDDDDEIGLDCNYGGLIKEDLEQQLESYKEHKPWRNWSIKGHLSCVG